MSKDDAVNFCSACGQNNAPDTTLCAHCHTPLVPLLTARITPPLPRESFKVTAHERPVFTGELRSGDFALMVVGDGRPLLHQNVKQITIGRSYPGEDAPGIDLTAYDAYLLGVSRQHASIQRSRDGYTLCDMESTNGTWVNDRRLKPYEDYPLKSGDLIRLGQLGIYIYFNESVVRPMQILLSDENAPKRLTPDYLQRNVTPFLVALSEIQSVADTILKRDAVLNIQSIAFENDRVVVTVESACEAIRFVEAEITQWRREHVSEIKEMRELKDMLRWLSDAPMHEKVETRLEELRLQTQPELLRLAFKFLKEVSVEPPELGQVVYIEKLLDSFYTLSFGSMVMVIAPALDTVS